MATETLIPEAEVHEYLGVKPLRPALVRSGPDLNIGVLNALGSKWLHRDDVLRVINIAAEVGYNQFLRDFHNDLQAGTA